MLSITHQALYTSHKAMALLVICVCLLNTVSLCWAQPMGDSATALNSNAHAMHEYTQYSQSDHCGTHKVSDNKVSKKTSMPCCDHNKEGTDSLASERCCEPVDGLAPTPDKPLWLLTLAHQSADPLWLGFVNPSQVLASVIKPPLDISYPARHLTLGVQLI